MLLKKIKTVQPNVILPPSTFYFPSSLTQLNTTKTKSGVVFFFIRNQRRYNKRRFSKARVYSRTSFFSSCSLACIFIGCF